MARFPKAVWRGPIPNESAGEMGQIMGLILHVEQGSEAGTNEWFHNPAAQASAHFGNPLAGPLDQWVDTANKAWAEVAGNSDWVSVEHAGFSGKSPTPTPSQIENDAQLLAWLAVTEDVPLQETDSPDRRGLGWHGMGGEAWGGHTDCPGQRVLDARKQIISRAEQLIHDTHQHPELRPGDTGPEVGLLQHLLNEYRHCGLAVDDDYGPLTEAQVNAVKRSHGWPEDGVAGYRVWHLLLAGGH